MSHSSPDEKMLEQELTRISLKAEAAMPDPDILVNTDLELDRFDKYWSKIITAMDLYDRQRSEIIRKEKALRDELAQLVNEEKKLKSALSAISVYKPKFPKRYKVILFSFLTNAAVHLVMNDLFANIF